MISVAIYINDKCIRLVRAVNRSGGDVSEYEILENGRKIKHYREDGAVPLAIRILEETASMSEGSIWVKHLEEYAKSKGIGEMMD